MTFSPGRILLISIIAGSMNVLPLLFIKQGADIILHYSLIQCFGEQFWQGDLYPRWCMSANAGLGSPIFMFYYPLPYYFTTLLYPLVHLGLTVEHIYILAVCLISAFTYYSCLTWLRNIVPLQVALLCAWLALWIPYRMEVLFFRSAFSELCFLAIFPLCLHFARQLSQEVPNVWPKLALAIATCMLCNVSAALIGIIGIIFYVGAKSGLRLKILKALALSLLCAGAIVSFYAMPAHYLSAYLNQEALATLRETWANGYINLNDAIHNHRLSVYLTGGMMVFAAFALGIWACFKFKDQYETKIWLWLATAAFIVMFPWSASLWDNIGFISAVLTPWRMQSLIMFALIYFLAISGKHFTSSQHWKGDFAALWVLLVLLGLLLTGSRAPESESLFNQSVKAQLIYFKAYRTRWNNYEYADLEQIVADADNPRRQNISIINGHGKISEQRWDRDSISFSENFSTPATIKIRHFYFPTWQATIDNQTIELLPEANTGWMLLNLPAGKHTIRIAHNMDNALPLPLRYIWIVSLLVVCLVGWRAWRKPSASAA